MNGERCNKPLKAPKAKWSGVPCHTLDLFHLSVQKFEIFNAGIIQLTNEFEFPAKTGFANNSMIIDLRLRF